MILIFPQPLFCLNISVTNFTAAYYITLHYITESFSLR